MVLGKIKKNLGLDCISKPSWEFFFGRNIMKPIKDLLYGYVPEGYDQEKEEKLYRLRKGYENNAEWDANVIENSSGGQWNINQHT